MQAGHRPAVVLSPAAYNERTGLMLCCPMTSQIKRYPFEVIVGRDKKSVVLADQVKSLDWRARQASYKGTVSSGALAEIRRKARALIGEP